MIRKIEAMHMLFGKCENAKCENCLFLSSVLYSRKYYKCDIYGDSRSEATDWAKSWTACGLVHSETTADDFRRQWGTALHYIMAHRPKEPEPQIEGQMCMEDFL